MSLHHFFFSPIHLISINYFIVIVWSSGPIDRPTDRSMVSESIFSGSNIGQQIHERTKCKSISNVGKLKKAIQFKYLTYIFRHFFWLCSHSTVFLGSLWIRVAIIIIIDEHWALSIFHFGIQSYIQNIQICRNWKTPVVEFGFEFISSALHRFISIFYSVFIWQFMMLLVTSIREHSQHFKHNNTIGW